VATTDVPEAPGHPFISKLNELLAQGLDGPEGRVASDVFVEWPLPEVLPR